MSSGAQGADQGLDPAEDDPDDPRVMRVVGALVDELAVLVADGDGHPGVEAGGLVLDLRVRPWGSECVYWTTVVLGE